MKVSRQQFAILSRQVNGRAIYFAELAERIDRTDLVYDDRLMTLAYQANNAVKALAELLAERVKSGYEFESPPGPV